MLIVTVGVLVLARLNFIDVALMLAMLAGVGVAIVGFVDDVMMLSIKTRVAVHFVCAGLAIYLLSGLPPLVFGAGTLKLGFYGYILGVFAIIWSINLFNFMDGIDGIAASEAIFVTFAAAAIEFINGATHAYAYTWVLILVAAASLGFLCWNWPPARIFMGDVGSGYLGYIIAILAIQAGKHSPVWIFVWLILGGFFFVDATFTLSRRILRRETLYVAHRTHAYQCLARHLKSHQKVTMLVWAVNVLWLFPLAWLATQFLSYAPILLIIALFPIVVFCAWIGGGKAEIAK